MAYKLIDNFGRAWESWSAGSLDVAAMGSGEAIPFKASLWTLDESLLDEVLDLDLDLDDETLGSDMMAMDCVGKRGWWRRFCLYWCWRGNGDESRQERPQRCTNVARAAGSGSKGTQWAVKMPFGLF